jgi:hypothetical protein
MWDMAGDYTHFEEVCRALFAGKFDEIAPLISTWPEDIRRYVEGKILLLEGLVDAAKGQPK